MQTQEFFGRVQNKAHLPTLGEAMQATRATLETLAERLGPDEATDLGAQLPREIRDYLVMSGTTAPEHFSSDEFLQRVCLREGGLDLPASTHHARAVIDVLMQTVSPGEVDTMLDRLPEDYRQLFASSESKMPAA
jgi:uncharacterized protein (DUF2267 family)